MRSLELFSGRAIFSKVAREYGVDTVTLDMDKKHNATIQEDILEVNISDLVYMGPFDVLWASPDCRAFSVSSIGKHWTGGKKAYIPKSDTARLGIELVERTLNIIEILKPKYWFIENPRDVLRNLPMMDLETLSERFGTVVYRRTIWQCRYHKVNPENGLYVAKPTDIWTNFGGWVPRPECRNRHPDHAPSPRGSRTGTQGGQSREERAELPRELCEEIWTAIGDDMRMIR